jgi:hypothetical protein
MTSDDRCFARYRRIDYANAVSGFAITGPRGKAFFAIMTVQAETLLFYSCMSSVHLRSGPDKRRTCDISCAHQKLLDDETHAKWSLHMNPGIGCDMSLRHASQASSVVFPVKFAGRIRSALLILASFGIPRQVTPWDKQSSSSPMRIQAAWTDFASAYFPILRTCTAEERRWRTACDESVIFRILRSCIYTRHQSISTRASRW